MLAKERLFNQKLDLIFWWLIWLLPLVGGMISVFTGGHDYQAFFDFIADFKFDFIYTLLVDVFNIAVLTLPDTLLILMSYIVSVELCHLLVDVLIFIPRFAHKLVQLDTYVDVEKGVRK